MIPAYEMREGVAVPCANYGRQRMRPVERLPVLDLPPLLPKRETRRAARAGGKRRRFWAPGTPPRRPFKAPPFTMPEFVRDVGHRFADGDREVLLYLPEADGPPGPEHVRALNLAIWYPPPPRATEPKGSDR